MSWDGGRSRSGAVIIGFRNGNRIVRVSPDTRHIQFTDLDTIPFWTISLAVLGRHSLEGGVDVRGHSYRPASAMEYLRPTTLDTFHPCNAPYVPPHSSKLPSPESYFFHISAPSTH